jgi:hypothetical protein
MIDPRADSNNPLSGMRCSVTLRLPDGKAFTLEPGDIIGRSPRAALRIDDPRVSEVHAYVSLRGAKLAAIALRGRLAVHGRPSLEVPLTEGTRLLLAGGFPLLVESVELPETLFALSSEAHHFPPTPLHGVTSLVLDPDPLPIPGFREEAAAVLWISGDGVRLRLRGELDQTIQSAHSFRVEGHAFRLERVPLADVAQVRTVDAGYSEEPLRIAVYFDTVHIHCADRTVALQGVVARLVSELADVRRPMTWESVSELLWPDQPLATRRSRWDQALHRLRLKLREGKVRADLIRTTHTGLYELYLLPRDTLKNHN